jgi:hypothetical protein
MKNYFPRKLNREQLNYVRWYVELAKAVGYQHAFNCFYHSFTDSPLFGDTSYYGAMRYFHVATEHVN